VAFDSELQSSGFADKDSLRRKQMNKKALNPEVIQIYDFIVAYKKLEAENEDLRGMVTALQAILDNQVLEKTSRKNRL
jgi:hypothetical protein